MKTYKKMLFGPSVFLLLSMVSLAGSKHVFAIAPTVTASNFSYSNCGNISGTINGSVVNFYDNNCSDPIRNFAPKNIDTAIFCQPTNIKYWGINIDKNVDLSKSPVPGTLVLGYWDIQANNKKCLPLQNIPISIDAPPDTALATYVWNNPNIVSANGNDTFSQTNLSNIYINQQNSGSCEASGLIITTGLNSGTLYLLSEANFRTRPSNIASRYQEIQNYLLNPKNCYVDINTSITIAGTPPQGFPNNCTDISCRNTSGAGTAITTPPGATSASCEAQDSGSFAWLICPLLRYIDNTIGFIDGQINDQLCFPDAAPITQAKAKCSNKTDYLGAKGTRPAWTNFKNIASALLVVALLVMVISQAMGSSLFDAYTIRKLLPRLVIATIAIQLSFYLVQFLIDLTNDVGLGITDLIQLPFSSNAANFTLPNLLGSGGGGQIFIFSAIALGIAGAIFIFASLALAVPILIGVVAAILVLVARKVLILFCVLTVPIALAAWVLPGTQKYWKLWWETFSKMLLMYPMIMALLAAGRAFAYLTKSSSSGLTFTVFLLVLIGYFGPYFILPKTFKWGGQALGAFSGAIQGMASKAGEKPKAFLKGRQELLNAERATRRAERMTDPTRTGWRRAIDVARGDRLITGQWDPTLGLRGSRIRQRRVGSYAAKAVGAEDEGRKLAALRLTQEAATAPGGDHDAFYRSIAGDKSRSQDERDAAMDKLAQLGGNANMEFIEDQQRVAAEAARRGDRSHMIAYKKFLDRSAPILTSKMPHLYYAAPSESADPAEVARIERERLVGTVDSMGPRALTQISPIAVRSVIKRLRAQGMAAEEGRLVSSFDEAMQSTIRPDMPIANSNEFNKHGYTTPPAGLGRTPPGSVDHDSI